MGLASTPENTSNTLLQSDLHITFDRSIFVFVSKPFSDPEHLQLVTHLPEALAELEYQYHNRRLQSITRFTWTIFPFFDGFLNLRMRSMRYETIEMLSPRGFFRFKTLSSPYLLGPSFRVLNLFSKTERIQSFWNIQNGSFSCTLFYKT